MIKHNLSEFVTTVNYWDFWNLRYYLRFCYLLKDWK